MDVLMRISAVLAVHQALENLFIGDADRQAWLTRPHKSQVFGGRAPLDLLASGEDKDRMALLRFLKAAETGAYMEPNDVDRGFQPYDALQIEEPGEAD